ncbi:hypothetical protein CALCODRAFT_434064, partial [Calocera cornea HHB12733]
DEWDQHADKACLIIGLTIDPSQYSYIQNPAISNGPEAWTALKNVYEQNSRANWITLKHAFYGYPHDTKKPIRDYVNGITNLAAQLQSIGIQLTDEDICDVFIWNLNPIFANIAGALAATKTLTISDISGALIEEESC